MTVEKTDNFETVRCPAGLRKQEEESDASQQMDHESYTVASGRPDQAMRDVPLEFFSTLPAPAAAGETASVGSSTHRSMHTAEDNGTTFSAAAGDWFSWLLPGVFPPIPPPPKTGARVYADNLSQASTEVNGEVIQDKQWKEILDATETLATRYKEHQDDTVDDRSERSISDETINEVNDAIEKFKVHAKRLGMKERDLMAAVRDDDRSIPSGLRRDGTITTVGSRKSKKDFVSQFGNATDKFVEMFEFYFTQANNS
jgi:hypothetical protein